MLESKILEAYADGSPLGLIIESFNITHKQLMFVLNDFKEKNKQKRTFTDDFKKIIAERDINGIPRRQIAQELNLNINTVKKACEKFGQSLKGRASSENLYTRIDREFDMSTCICGSKKVNEVDENTTFCMSCGAELIHNEEHILKVNWEYLPED